MESWLFTDVTVDLLGVRRIAFEGTASWWRIHLGAESALGRGRSRQRGLAWYDIGADGRLESWRPDFLVFGMTDVQRDDLTWRRAQLAVCSLGLRWTHRSATLGLEVQQPVFARLIDHERAQAAGAPSTASGI